ncbi:MAG: DUF1326 domain-containing protein [Terriglobia bacterium]|jgi:hypothetical protein|nr:DUF1326 domain-containing protein [Terriglobia bacterium]
MRRTLLLALAGISLFSVSLFAQQIQGEYMETRSADVYTGQCFANGEVNLAGREAIMAWKVDRGSWDGVKLDGLGVAAAVRTNGTLGDPYENPYPAKSVLIVDDHASPQQKDALISLAKHYAGRLLDNVVEVKDEPVMMELPQNEHQHGLARMMAGDLASIQTRPLNDMDHLCGNEVTFYPPLVKLVHAVPAVAVTDRYAGPGLGENWTIHDKRSAFLGRFSEGMGQVAENLKLGNGGQ